MLDAIIVGAGPAGMAAAVYMARQKLKFAILTNDVGGQTLLSDDVENYLGFHLLDGGELVKKFREHLKDYADQFELKEQEPVERIDGIAGGFRVVTPKGMYDTRTVLIATGTIHRTLNVPGERDLYGKGVTYCANCDAPLFRGKNVYVVGGGNSAMDAALFLEKYTMEITMVVLNPELMGDSILRAKIMGSKNIRVLSQTKTTKIVGTDHVTGIGLLGPDGEERTEPCDGVFIEVGLRPVSGFIDLVAKDKLGQIIVDKVNRTNVPGIFAAGDVTDITEKQISVAVGEGSKAALQLISYIARMV